MCIKEYAACQRNGHGSIDIDLYTIHRQDAYVFFLYRLLNAKMTSSALVPRNKYDFERLNALMAADPSAAIPILDELLVWSQYMN